jgi:hypothetical protein
MTTYYVGIGGDDGATGATWALRKATLNGAENIPVAAGDTVYVGPGTYREILTVDVSGTSGAGVITYIGDYTGANTDGVGGVVRITGSADDKSASGANCVLVSAKNNRTFQGFLMDTTTSNLISLTNATYFTLSKCVLDGPSANQILCAGASQLAVIIQNCFFLGGSGYDIAITHTSTVSNAGHIVQNCIFVGGASRGINSIRVGGVTVKNNVFFGKGGNAAVRIETALAGGQTITVNNNIFRGCTNALTCMADGEITENYNTFFGNSSDRSGGTPANWTGVNSITYPPLFDARWFFQLTHAGAYPSAKQLVSPFDLASYSQLVDLAGTSPSATDLRDTGTLGAQREWGALEYDSTLDIQAKRGSFVSGGLIGA